MSGFGKSLEAVARKLRPYLSAKHRRAYAAMVSRGMSQHRPGEKIVCCDFSNQAIDSVGGRYYFSLVRDLIDAGYFPVFTAHRQTLSTFGTSRMKALLLEERLGVVRFLDELREPYFLITDRDAAAPGVRADIDTGRKALVQALAQHAMHPSALVREHVAWALAPAGM